MDTLSYVITDDNGLSFELCVNGTPLGELIRSQDNAIPYWMIGEELPRHRSCGDGLELDARIVIVCSCGEYGCGHACCRIIVDDEVVTFCDFAGDVRGEGARQI